MSYRKWTVLGARLLSFQRILRIGFFDLCGPDRPLVIEREKRREVGLGLCFEDVAGTRDGRVYEDPVWNVERYRSACKLHVTVKST